MIIATAFTVVALAVSAPEPGASAPWDLDADTQVLQHTPSGVRFPPKVGGLDRQQHSFGRNPYTPEAASISYGTPEKSGLLITLIPVAELPETTAEKLFAARVLLFRNQHPDAVLANVTPITSSCKRAGPFTHLSAFDLPAGRESFYSTVLRGHVVYVRATERAQGRGAPTGAALADFLSAMEWPCSISPR